MIKKQLLICFLSAASLCSIGLAQESKSEDSFQLSVVSREIGLANWQKFYEIASHPRCANCHVDESNVPMWSGPSYGKTRVHGMNINAGDSRIGAEHLPCTTCHGKENSALPHGPPGNEVWKLPPVEMVWWQKSSIEICEQIKDPERNGEKSLEELVEHVRDDELVHWGWEPGGLRQPAPYSINQAVKFLELWIEAKTPCPE